MSNPAHRPAGIVTRCLAAGVDLLVVLVMMGGLYAAAVFIRLLFSPQQFAFPDVGALLSVSLFMGISTGYLTVCWAVSGRTLGAVTMGLRVVSRNGELIGWARAAARAALYVMFGFGLFWVVVDPQRRSLQDIVLRTAVVYDWQPDPRPHLGDAAVK